MAEKPKRERKVFRDAMRGRNRFTVSKMADEEIDDMLDLFSNSSEGEQSGDEDYEQDISELSPEDDEEIVVNISELRRSGSNEFLSNAISMSLNLSNISFAPFDPIGQSSPSALVCIMNDS